MDCHYYTVIGFITLGTLQCLYAEVNGKAESTRRVQWVLSYFNSWWLHDVLQTAGYTVLLAQEDRVRCSNPLPESASRSLRSEAGEQERTLDIVVMMSMSQSLVEVIMILAPCPKEAASVGHQKALVSPGWSNLVYLLFSFPRPSLSRHMRSVWWPMDHCHKIWSSSQLRSAPGSPDY